MDQVRRPTTSLTLFVCSVPMKCQRTSGNSPYLPRNSWTRFSPKSSHAGVECSADLLDADGLGDRDDRDVCGVPPGDVGRIGNPAPDRLVACGDSSHLLPRPLRLGRGGLGGPLALAGDQVRDPLADVDGVVGDPLEVAARQHHRRGPLDVLFLLQARELAEELLVEVVDRLVELGQLARELQVALLQAPRASRRGPGTRGCPAPGSGRRASADPGGPRCGAWPSRC